MSRPADQAPKWRPLYCECGECEDCDNAPIEVHALDGSVQLFEKEPREHWKARTERKDI